MSSSSGPAEYQANAPVATAMDAKMIVATASGDVQQLKDLVKKEESQMMVVMMAKQHAASMEKHQSQQGNIDPHLLALASSGSAEKLRTLLNSEAGQAFGHGSGTQGRSHVGFPWCTCIMDWFGAGFATGGTDGGLTTRRASSYSDDIEANGSILEGVTAEGDTALHVVAAFGHGDNFFTWSREAKHLLLVEQNNNNNNNKRRQTRTERYALTTYGDGDNFLESARIIYRKAKHLLFVQNKKGDTPLHCAAQAGKSKMVACLIDLALAEGDDSRVMKELLRKENKHKETALHEAVRVGNKDIVDLLMDKDPELASFLEDGGASPMYLAMMLNRDEIVKTLYDKSSDGKLSFSGPNGQNALHAAVLRHRDLRKLLDWNERHLRPQNKDLTTQRDENGSTPLHFAAVIEFPCSGSRNCWQVLEANPDALYQADHAGFFPIHIAASVGAFKNVDMFIKKCPGSAGLRDARGRTFLHVAVEKKQEGVIGAACRNLSLSWILNMVDKDGNTALHLAVEAGSLQMFCALLGNPRVNLNLPNNRGETPLDIAQHKLPKRGFYYIQMQSIEAQIHLTLTFAGAVMGVCRHDPFKEAFDESKEMKVLKESTGAFCIGSVLISTVTFGANFAVPGGYIADDHNNGGSPILARRFAFDAFIGSNTLAFVFSTIATIALIRSGNPLSNLWSRKTNLRIAFYFVSISITCLAAAFALAAYVVLAPVAEDTALGICIWTSLVLVYNQMEFILTHLHLLPPLCRRKGVIRAWVFSALVIMSAMVLHYWPYIVIFGLAASQKSASNIIAPLA